MGSWSIMRRYQPQLGAVGMKLRSRKLWFRMMSSEASRITLVGNLRATLKIMRHAPMQEMTPK